MFGIAILGFFIAAISLPEDFYTWLTVACIALFLAFVRVHGKLSEKSSRARLEAHLIRLELLANGGDHSGFQSGHAYVDVKHPYSFDLDIFGDRSLFQMVSRSVTIDGARALADEFREPFTNPDEIKKRQEVTLELSGYPDLLLAMRVEGASYEEGAEDVSRLLDWFKLTDIIRNSFLLRVVIFLVPAITMALILASFLTEGLTPFFTIVIVFNWILLGIKSKQIKETAYYVAKGVSTIDKYEALLGELSKHKFRHPYLIAISEKAAIGLAAIQQLRKLAHLFESRSNGMVGPLMNTFFLFDLQCVLRLEQWRKENRDTLSAALETVTILDVYTSKAIYSFNHPEYIYPQISDHGASIRAIAMSHPLLPEYATGNDFSIGEQEQLFLLTGANMTGKSTFIRTVGVN
ncbi:MAG: hypothetical protein EOO01_37260, partial [Chitinophagaceae bacterium]